MIEKQITQDKGNDMILFLFCRNCCVRFLIQLRGEFGCLHIELPIRWKSTL